jgi:hypothetical protein
LQKAKVIPFAKSARIYIDTASDSAQQMLQDVSEVDLRMVEL